MKAKYAKRLNKMVTMLLEKIKQAEKENAKRLGRTEREMVKGDYSDVSDETETRTTHIKPDELTVSNAQELDKLKRNVYVEFDSQYQSDIGQVNQPEKKFEPITKAIKETNYRMSKELVRADPELLQALLKLRI